MNAAPAESAKYAQIAAELRRRIEARAYPSGELPSTGELAAEFGVALKTVQRALFELDRAGLTAGRPGRPRFVVHGTDDNSRTRYEQVAARLRRDIRLGVLLPGGRVPPEPVLRRSTVCRRRRSAKRSACWSGRATSCHGRGAGTWPARALGRTSRMNGLL